MWPIMIWRRQDSFARVLGHLSDTCWELFHSLIFCTTVEQALGVELQHLVTTEMHKSSGGEQSRSQSTILNINHDIVPQVIGKTLAGVSHDINDKSG